MQPIKYGTNGHSARTTRKSAATASLLHTRMTTAPTDHELALQQLAEAHRRTEALSFFARRMAHDLSNFLTVIRTYSELLLSDLPNDHPNRADLDEIAQAADTTVAYMQRCSAFGRAATAKAAPVTLDALVHDVLQQADAAGLGPFDVSATSGAQIMANASGLADAMNELLTNAREASPAPSVISVNARIEELSETRVDSGVPVNAGTWAVVEIMDTGSGLSQAVAANAFDPFVTSKSGVRGAGLGLTLARATAWAAGGELTLGSHDGRTAARMYLPLVVEASVVS